MELIDVRAANSLYVQYDFDRDGWVITMPHPDLNEDGSEVLHEVAFVPAWASGDPEGQELTHSFDARTAADDEVWCTGCDCHRDHPIHVK